ncbi:MAG: hypothetical protein ACR2KO_01145 [Geodermatophilaceae bacterium]
MAGTVSPRAEVGASDGAGLTADRESASCPLAMGAAVAAVIVGAHLLAWAWRWRLAAVMCLFAFAGVTQELACGTALEACGSLLPGF